MKKILFLIVILFFASNIPNNLFGQARKYVSNSTTGTTVDTIVFTQQVKSGTDTTTKKTGVMSIQILSYGATTDTLKYWTDRYGFIRDKGILVGKQKAEIVVKGTKTIDTLYLQGNATITRSITAGFIDEINIEDYSVPSGASTSENQSIQITRADTTIASSKRIETYVDGIEATLNQINNMAMLNQSTTVWDSVLTITTATALPSKAIKWVKIVPNTSGTTLFIGGTSAVQTQGLPFNYLDIFYSDRISNLSALYVYAASSTNVRIICGL
ncbi:MAG: hypothetical protein ABIJ40_15480 [Bacteroidota bacterium]